MPQMKLFGNSRSAARVAGKRKPDSEQAPKEKKQKKKILLYRKIYCERQHQLTLFFVRAVQKDCNKAYASTKAFLHRILPMYT